MAKRHSHRQRAQLLEAYRCGGLTQREFCAANQISTATLSNWLRKAREADGCATPSGTQTVVELPLAQTTAGHSPVTIELPSRVLIHCQPRQTAVVLSQIALAQSPAAQTPTS